MDIFFYLTVFLGAIVGNFLGNILYRLIFKPLDDKLFSEKRRLP